MTFCSRNRAALVDLMMLACLWALIVILVNPCGDFPLNDDWSYGKTVKHLLDEGVFRPTGWTSMTLVAQVLWGAVFCKPFGFSFTALRISTLLLGLFGIFSTYALLRIIKAPRLIAMFAALTVATNAIYFQLSNTFMTDVPFITFTNVSLIFFLRYLQNANERHFFLGIVFSCTALLIRQIGVFIPIGFAVAYVFKSGISFRSLLKAVTPLITVLTILLGFELWLALSVGLPAMYYLQIKQTATIVLSRNMFFTLKLLSKNTLYALIYLGLFLFPFMIVLIPHQLKELKRVQRFLVLGVFCVFVIATFFVTVLQGRYMPLVGNVLINFGLGPIMIRDALLELPHMPTGNIIFPLTITGIGILGAGLLVATFTVVIKNITLSSQAPRCNGKESIAIFLLSSCCAYLFMLGFITGYDRYYVPLMPSFAVLAVISINKLRFGKRRFSLAIGALFLCIYSIFSVVATHDYLTFNRTRWNALNTLTEKDGIPPSQIDGGFEFNGWYLYGADYKVMPDKSSWWVQDDMYLIALNPVTRFDTVKEYPFFRWTTLEKAKVYVLRRQ